jgi:MFS family permease
MTAGVVSSTRSLPAWRNSVLLVFGIAGFGLASWLVRVPAARDGLEATTFQMGILALAISVGSVLGFVTASRVARRLSPRRVIWTSLIVSAFALVAAGLGSSAGAGQWGYAITLGSLVLYGLGNGTCNVTMNVEGAAVERGLGRPVMPWFHAVFSIGSALGGAAGALAAALGVPPSVHLSIVGVLMMIAASLSVRQLSAVPPASSSSENSSSAEDWGADHAAGDPARGRSGSAWLDPRTLLIGLVVLGMSFANGAANDWIALAMVDGHGVDDGVAALTVDAFVIVVVITRLCGVSLLARFGRVRVVQGSAVFAVAGILIFTLAPNPVVAVCGAVFWGAGIALAFPIGMSAAADDPAKAAGRIALVAAIGYAGSLVGPPLIGFVAEGAGILDALFIALGFAIAAGLVAPVLRRQKA